MGGRVCLDVLARSCFISRGPQHAGHLSFSAFLGSTRGHDLQPGVRVRNTRASQESIRRVPIIFAVEVVDKSQVVVETPLVRIVTYPLLHERNRFSWHSGALGRLGG